MRLAEQRDVLVKAENSIIDDIQTSLEYLSSNKFQNGEDWIRTWEVENILRNIRSKVIDSLDEVGQSFRVKEQQNVK